MYARLKGMRWAITLLRMTPLDARSYPDGPGRLPIKRARAARERHQTLARLRISERQLKCRRAVAPGVPPMRLLCVRQECRTHQQQRRSDGRFRWACLLGGQAYAEAEPARVRPR